MPESIEWPLLGTAFVTGVLHTLIPDHWLPFVLIGRARNWSGERTAFVSGCSALLHVGLSVLLGLFALGIGLTVTQVVGETLERGGALAVIAFGLAYAFWSWRKGGHFHPGGSLLHPHDEACSGEEGDANPKHLHYHADGELIARAKWSDLGLAAIVGLNPCVLMLPIFLSAARLGGETIALAAVAYSAPTVALVVGLSVAGVCWRSQIRLPGPARYMESGSGLLIAALGVAMLLFH